MRLAQYPIRLILNENGQLPEYSSSSLEGMFTFSDATSDNARLNSFFAGKAVQSEEEYVRCLYLKNTSGRQLASNYLAQATYAHEQHKSVGESPADRGTSIHREAELLAGKDERFVRDICGWQYRFY